MSRAPPVNDVARLQRRLASQSDLLDKLKAIRALHITAYNAPVPVDRSAVEFFFALGDILEGRKVTELNLTTIDMHEFLRELQDG